MSDKERENSLNEVRILASIKNNVNLVRYHESFIERDGTNIYLCLVMELATKGDLLQKIAHFKRQKMAFTENEIWKVAIQVIYGLKSMHDLHIMHRDIKSANVFLTNSKSSYAHSIDEDLVKLGDMNVSKIATQEHMNHT